MTIIIKKCNRQRRVILLYISLVVVVAFAATKNRHGETNNNSVDVASSYEASITTSNSEQQGGNDVKRRLPLHLQHHRQVDDVSFTRRRYKRPSRSSKGLHDNDSPPLVDKTATASQQPRKQQQEEANNRIMMMTSSSSSSIHGKSTTANETIKHSFGKRRRRRPPLSSHPNDARQQQQQQQRPSSSSSQHRRRLNRSGKDVLKAIIEEDRSELEEILGHPIYQYTKSSKAMATTTTTDEEEVKKWVGDSWMTAGGEEESTGDTSWGGGDPWAGDTWTGGSDSWSSSSGASLWTGSGDSWSSSSSASSWTAGDDSHHGLLPTGWSNDGWDFNPHYATELNHLRADIIQLMEESERELLPKCLRLAFHDCMGGCNGCIDPTVIDNRGLDEPVEKLYPLVQKYRHKFSRADVWAYCAIVAADMAVVENRPEDLHFYMHYIGRNDCDGADEKGGFGEVSI